MRLFSIFTIAIAQFMWTLSVCAHDIALPKTLEELSLIQINKYTYVAHGIHALPDKNNKGYISNTGIVISDAGVVIIDSGGSLQVGRLIIAKIRDLTNKPVIAVFNTHVHGDHWLGNTAIREAFPKVKIYAHKRAIERLQNGEAEQWIDILLRMTENATAAASMALPDQALVGGETLSIVGNTYVTHHTGHAHTDNDIMIEVAQDRLLFSGDIIEHGRAVSSDVPQDFDIKGQIKALKYALELPIETYVPGHGASGGREIPEDALRFLEILNNSVKRNYDAGMQDFEMRDIVEKDLLEFSHWFGMDQLGKLISYVYQQVEKSDFE